MIGIRGIQSKAGDGGSMIVGEWGVVGTDGPNDLTSVYSDIVQNSWSENERYLPDIMFYFSHHIQDETVDHDHPVVWGFRRYDFYTRSPDQSQVRFSIKLYDHDNAIDERALPLRNRYASLLHGQALHDGQ